METQATYIAIRPVRSGRIVIRPGEPVPGVEAWPSFSALLSQGVIAPKGAYTEATAPQNGARQRRAMEIMRAQTADLQRDAVDAARRAKERKLEADRQSGKAPLRAEPAKAEGKAEAAPLPEIGSMNTDDALALVASTDDVDHLAAFANDERKQKRPRKKLIEAINARMRDPATLGASDEDEEEG